MADELQLICTKNMFDLRKSVIDGSVQVSEIEAQKHTCVFCNQRIFGKMYLLRKRFPEEGEDAIYDYSSHIKCYEELKYSVN